MEGVEGRGGGAERRLFSLRLTIMFYGCRLLLSWTGLCYVMYSKNSAFYVNSIPDDEAVQTSSVFLQGTKWTWRNSLGVCGATCTSTPRPAASKRRHRVATRIAASSSSSCSRCTRFFHRFFDYGCFSFVSCLFILYMSPFLTPLCYEVTYRYRLPM